MLQLEVDPSGPAFDLEVPLEVIIGTIPLRMFIPTFASQYPPPAAPLHPIGGPPPDGAQGGTISPSAPDLRKLKFHVCLVDGREKTCLWGFLTKQVSNQSPQQQRLARKFKFHLWQVYI